MQGLVVALIVIGCAAYAAWALMPSALRRALARRTQHWPWPRFMAQGVRRAATAPTGCGCDAGCKVKAPPAAQPIRIHRRPRA